MKRWLCAMLLGAALILPPSQPANAQSLAVEPLFIETQPGQSAAIRVRNSSSVRQTVEVSIAERVADEAGEVARVPADDDFILFPPQSVIEPNSVQVFRAQSINPTLDRSKSYYITVRQLPVDLTMDPVAGGAQLQVVFAFDVAMHTVPRGAASNAVISSATPTTTTMSAVAIDDPARSPDPAVRAKEPRIDVPGVEIVLRNDGNKYLYLHHLEYLISGQTAQGEKIDLPILSEDEVLEAVTMPLVLPGAARKFILPFRNGPILTSATVRVRTRAGY
ncbi:Pili and flagellar-assembly chaperone, PapD N-terminal domain [Sphingopyxis flava]|uniref:Pili and flagellar-assembly chaperone, PapD N-terminal domain n=2 Tax=Sphingopyxis flava TaxID=1507287 RepID=A0A1T5DGY5_9SPHN|nr:Pili and flagellar-assembly chaperone, PapD N-terminal domain [Sphingopyxis flava]